MRDYIFRSTAQNHSKKGMHVINKFWIFNPITHFCYKKNNNLYV